MLPMSREAADDLSCHGMSASCDDLGLTLQLQLQLVVVNGMLRSTMLYSSKGLRCFIMLYLSD